MWELEPVTGGQISKPVQLWTIPVAVSTSKAVPWVLMVETSVVDSHTEVWQAHESQAGLLILLACSEKLRLDHITGSAWPVPHFHCGWWSALFPFSSRRLTLCSASEIFQVWWYLLLSLVFCSVEVSYSKMYLIIRRGTIFCNTMGIVLARGMRNSVSVRLSNIIVTNVIDLFWILKLNMKTSIV